MHQNPQTAYQRSISNLLMNVRPAPLASFLKRTFGVKRFAVNTSQGKFWIDPVSNFGREICEKGIYEVDLSAIIQKYILPGSTFVDLGANEGYFTVLGALLVGPTGRVVSIEPQQRLLEVIEHNLQLNGITWATVVNAAVTDKPGEVAISLAPDINSGSSGIHPQTKYRLPTQKVQSRTLCQVLDDAELASVDFMKIDIESFEYEALMGSPEIVREHRVRNYVIELHPEVLKARNRNVEDIRSLLLSNGYRRADDKGWDVWLSAN